MAERPDEDKFVTLRRQAEEILQDQPAYLANLSVEDTQALIHNLQIQRIELELQNEELRRAHLEPVEARDRYAELQTSEQLAHSSEQLRELSARLQSVREEERTRIARAIHDELGQTLTGLKMDVAWLQKHLDQPRPMLLAKMQAMSQLIDITIQTVRRISTELRPGLLDDLGLAATIEWQLQEFQTRTGIEGNLISAPEETTLDAEGATTVFRIFQEILTNVVRHAQASQVEVTLEETDTFLTLQVQDNGRGMTESELHSPKSIGLLGMQERARLRAGEVHFQGAPGRGTIVTVRLPLAIDNGQ